MGTAWGKNRALRLSLLSLGMIWSGASPLALFASARIGKTGELMVDRRLRRRFSGG